MDFAPLVAAEAILCRFTSGKLRRAAKKLETMTFFPDCGGDGGTLSIVTATVPQRSCELSLCDQVKVRREF
jgi:hypothetical protein